MKLLSHPAGLIAGVALVVIACGLYAAAKPTSATYTDPRHRFSVELPAHVKAEYLPAEDGSSETVIFDGGAAGVVQMTITPWAHDVVLSTGALAKDYPSLAGKSVEPTTVAGANGLTVDDQQPARREVWFAASDYLYELVGWGDSTGLLGKITSGWKFF